MSVNYIMEMNDNKEIKIFKVEDNSLRENISFIYNRFDLWASVNEYDLWCCEEEGEEHYFEVCFRENGTAAWVGLYLLTVSPSAMKQIMKQLFSFYSHIRQIKYINSRNALGDYWIHCDWILNFPETEGELDSRLSKKSRLHLKQHLKQLDRNHGSVEFKHYLAETEEGIEIVKKFIYLKRCSHGTVYTVTPLEYIRKFHVTDTYCLLTGGELASLILSCEQCPVLYMDNLSYDKKFAKYSPGMLLYNHYLKEMLKRKRSMYLGDGEYKYKAKYGTEKVEVYDGTVFRNIFWRVRLKELPMLKKKYRNTWWYKTLRHIKNKLYKLE